MKINTKFIIGCFLTVFFSIQTASTQEVDKTEIESWLSSAKEAEEKKDGVEALKWYKKAAERGSAIAQLELGNIHNIGVLVEEDMEKAIYWYKLAGNNGNASAQVSLGSIYQYGQGISRNYKEATKWYEMAAKQNNSFALYALGIMYQIGYVEKSEEKAQGYFKKACELGEEDACKRLNN